MALERNGGGEGKGDVLGGTMASGGQPFASFSVEAARAAETPRPKPKSNAPNIAVGARLG